VLSDEGFQPVSNWAQFLLKEEWAEPGAGNASQLAAFLEQEGYAHPRNSYNREMRNLLEKIYHDPTTFYSGQLANTIAEELKVN
jgi:gamma-glutamyltranspeptidase